MPVGARLLENHQAHLVGALRTSLAPSARSAAGPSLAMAGGHLAMAFLESGLAAGGLAVVCVCVCVHVGLCVCFIAPVGCPR